MEVAEKTELCLISACKLSNIFCNLYIIGPQPDKVGRIKEDNKIIGEIFRVDSNLSICQLTTATYLSEGEFGSNLDLAEKLLTLADKIVVLQSKHLRYYQCEDGIETETLTRWLKNQWDDEEVRMSLLEAPNELDGIPSAVMKKAKLGQKPCAALINFADGLNPDSISLGGFSPLFEWKCLKGLKPRKDALERLKKLTSDDSLLYV